MKKPVSFTKVGFDLFTAQLIWTFWALGIFIGINIIQKIFSVNQDSIYHSGLIASNIYMFVIGIISIAFLAYYVEMGITRKNYFYGNLLASLGLAIVIPIILYVVSLVETFIIERFTSMTLSNTAVDEMMAEVIADTDGHIIVEFIFTFIFSPFAGHEVGLFLSFVVFSVNLFLFYLVGWMIGAAFKRIGVIGGIIFVFLGISMIAVKDSAIRMALDIPLFENFAFLNVLPDAVAIPLVLIVVLIPIVLIRLLTKRVPVDA